MEKQVIELYKARHKNKNYRNDHKKYIIDEWGHWDQTRLDLYTKWLDHYKIIDILEKKWWIFIKTSESSKLIQCNICFEYDYHTEFYKYDLNKLWKHLNTQKHFMQEQEDKLQQKLDI